MSRRRKPTTTTTPGRMGRMAGWPLRPPGRVIDAVTRRGRPDARTDASGWWNARLAVRAMSLAIVVALAVALSPSSAPVQAADPPPGTPSSVSVTRSNGALTASWDAVKYATSYHITYSSDGGGSWSLAALNHAGTRISIGVSNSETYLVGVRARNDAGDGGWRNSPSVGPFVLTPPPATPASVSVTRADGALTASWGAVKGATSYHVTYSSDGGGSWSLAASNHAGTSITISGADNSKSYLVGVRARNEGGDSGWRNSPTIAPYTPSRSLTFGSHTVSDQSWTQDTAIDTLRLPAATSACEGVCTTVEPRVTYTLSPSLPSGVSFDASARTVSGTPTAVAASATYTYTATADGHTAASLTFSIAVAAPGLSFGGATVADQSWNVATAIDTLTLPAASGAAGAITYSLSPGLPDGLSFDAAARTITGTPTETADSATYNYTATDGADTVALSFAIEVLEEQGASAQAGLTWVTTPTDQKWQQGTAVNVQLPAATGADTIVYSLVNSGQSNKLDLPPGLSWNASTRTISGTPTSDFSGRVFVYNAAATNKGTHSNLIFMVADTNGNYPPHRNIKSNKAQLLAQLWSHYDTNPGMSCYSGSITFAPSSGHSVHFVDPDGDTMTFTAGSSDMVSTSINSNGYAVMTLKHPPLDWYYVHYTATDPSGLTDSIQLGVKTFKCTHSLSIQENKPKDTVVGSVGGPNPGGSSFVLNGDAKTYFDIDSSTGQITVKDGTTLDYETKTQYTGNFRYTVAGKSTGGDIRINVNDVRAPNVDRPTLAQNSTNPTTSLDVSWTAPTPMTGTTINDYDVRYRQWGTSSWTEMADTTNSTATSATITGLTAGTEYEVQVRSQIVDEGPGHWSGSSLILYLAENTAVNGNVGGKFNVNATDYYPLSFTLGGTDGSKFKLSTDTGYKTAQSAQIQVKTGNVPDFESKTSYSLTLRAVENNLQRNILDVTYSVLVIVTDVSEPPAAPSAPTVAANSTTPTTKLDVSWTAPTNTGKPAISDYDVQYRQTGVSTWSSHSFTGTGTSTTLSGLTAGKKYDVQVRAVNDEGNGAWSDTGNAITTSTAVTRSVAENTAASGNVGAAVTMTPGSYTLAHSLDGTDKGKFEIDATTGQITVKSGTSLDYESGTTSYSVEVKIAVTGTGNSNSAPNGTGAYTIPVTISVTDVNEPPPKLSAPTVSANATTPSTKIDVSWTAPTTTQMSGKPAVSDYDVQYRLSGGSTWTDASYTGTGTSTTLTGLTKGKSYEVQVRAVNAEGDGAWSNSGSAITDANAVTRSVAENSASGANVGAAVTATSNPNSYTLTHALSGTDASKFEIGSGTGQITVKSGTSLDYETKSSYTVTVTVTAASGGGANAQSLDPNAPGAYTVPVTINVSDVNEPPAFADDTATRSVAENSAASTNIGAVVTATDPDGVAKFNTLTYSLSGTDASKFNIGSSTGQITVKTGNIPDYEAKTSYSVTVNVSDGKNAGGTADTSVDDTIAVTINVTDVNEPPVKLSAPTVSANSATPATKLDVSWTAPTTTQMSGKPAVDDYDVRYRQVGASNWSSHSFTGTGTSTTLTGLTKGKTYEVQVRAGNDEGDGAWSDSGTAITKAGDVTRSIDENSAAGANVGSAVTATNSNYTYSHALSGTDASKFSISSSTGQITLGTGTTLDYESGTTSYSVVVTVTAAAKSQGANAQSLDPNAPGSYVVPVTINVSDVDEPPPAPNAPTVTQNTATPKTKLDVSWTALTNTQMDGKPAVSDYDVQYKKSSDSTWTSHSFTGTGTSTTLTGLTEGTSYDVQVRAVNDEGDGAWSDSGTTNTQDKNVHADFPDTTATRSIAENSAAGTNVGAAVTASDTENHTLYYSLNGTDKDEFDIGLNTGQITVKTDKVPDYEAKTSYSVTVEVSDRKDKDDNADTKIDDTIAVTINVTDEDEPPEAPAISVSANATTPATKIDVSWTAPDMTGKPDISDYDVQYRLSGDSSWTSHSFTGTGTSTTISGLTEGKSYEVQVRAVNDEGDGAWSAIGSAITSADAVTRSVAENSAAGTNVGAAVTATSNPNNYTLTHSLSGTDAAKFEIGSGTGQITVKSGTNLDYETKTTYTVVVTVKAASAGANAQSFSLAPNAPGDYVVPVTINVTNVNEGPKFAANTATRSVAENSLAGASIGAAVVAGPDPEGDTRYYSLSGTDAASFNIGATTGQISVKDALDYEAKTSYSVTVNVTDKKKPDGTADTAIDDSIAVTINVTDVKEPPDAPDAPSVARNSTTPKTVIDVSWTAPVMTGKPPITDYDVQYKKSSDSTWTSHSFSGTGTSTTISGLTGGTSYTVQIQAKNDEGASAWSDSGSVKTEDKNVNPKFLLNGPSASVYEDASTGAAVGTPVTATDTEGHTLTYSISGASEFTIDSATGQIRLAAGADLDYESGTTSYTVTVSASDGLDSEDNPDHIIDASTDVTISVLDVPEPPDAVAAPAVAQNASAPETALDVSWTAPNMDGKPAISGYDVQYREKGASSWTAHATNVQGTSTTITGLTKSTEYDVEVKAKNNEGESGWSPRGNGETKDQNFAPRFPVTPPGPDVAENAAAGTAVGSPVTAADTENNTLTYSISGASEFTIDSASGQIEVAAGADLDYESGTTSYTVTVSVSDGLDDENNTDPAIDDTIDVTISVTDENEPPDAPAAPSVAQNASAPTTSLDVSWTAPDTTGKPDISGYDVQYKKSSDATWTAHSFTGTGVSTTLTGLDDGTSYDVQVKARNDEGESAWSAGGTSSTRARNRAPKFAAGGTASVAENTAAGTNVGSPVTATDADGDTLTYSISGASEFTIDSASGQIAVASGADLDYESGTTSYTVTVSVSDGLDEQGNADSTVDDTATVTISVTDVNEPPAAPGAPSVAQNSAAPETSLDVSWKAPSTAGKPAISGYDVRYKKSSDATWTSHSFSGAGTSTTLSGLTEGTSYDVQVQAKNDEGSSGWSASGSGKTKGVVTAVVPTTPTTPPNVTPTTPTPTTPITPTTPTVPPNLSPTTPPPTTPTAPTPPAPTIPTAPPPAAPPPAAPPTVVPAAPTPPAPPAPPAPAPAPVAPPALNPWSLLPPPPAPAAPPAPPAPAPVVAPAVTPAAPPAPAPVVAAAPAPAPAAAPAPEPVTAPAPAPAAPVVEEEQPWYDLFGPNLSSIPLWLRALGLGLFALLLLFVKRRRSDKERGGGASPLPESTSV